MAGSGCSTLWGPKRQQGWVGRGILRCNRHVFLGGTRSHLAKADFSGWKTIFCWKANLGAHRAGGLSASGQDAASSPWGRRAAGGAGARGPRQHPGAAAGVRCQPGGGTAVPCCHLTGTGPPAAGRAAGGGEAPSFPVALLPRGVGPRCRGVQVTRGLHPPCSRSDRPVQREHHLGAVGWGGTCPPAVRGN